AEPCSNSPRCAAELRAAAALDRKNPGNNVVCVVVPVYNVQDYLPTCMESLLAQTYEPTQIILVDDGSCDGCAELCDQYAALHPGVVSIHKRNGGLSSARNAGLGIARGAFVSFVDSDDYVAPRFVELLHAAMVDSDATMSVCAFTSVDQDHVELETVGLAPGVVSPEGYWNQYFVPYSSAVPKGAGAAVVAWNKLYSSKIFGSLRYAEGKLYEDEFMLYDVVSSCTTISIISDALYYYLQRSGSIMGTDQGLRFLDQAEGNFIKCRGFVDEQQYAWASSALLRTIPAITRAERAARSDEDAQRIREAHATFRQLYDMVAPHASSREMRTRGRLFARHPWLYFHISHVLNRKG
ncbi:MAG: glycosyltransferase, partial [Coriobacteriales bacterium]|nr:glycosyltransferase [Coriobacteriales bacterium]